MKQIKPVLADDDRERLKDIVGQAGTPKAIALRARIVLDSDMKTRRAVSRELSVAVQTVAKWQRRYIAEGVNGLYDRPRPGKPRRFPREELASLIRQTLATECPSGSGWSVRRVAKATGLSPATVGRAWRDLLRNEDRCRPESEANHPGPPAERDPSSSRQDALGGHAPPDRPSAHAGAAVHPSPSRH
ncbi:helix-turn-helix domain-containing protein [Chelatococcus sp. GCM10030263]|uniref:helix-turn-helix domain-containing protein n=1 Tax=Chelatococcus sp. GCM10030263 TaxID=3273387 RepID=UPI0036092F4C